MDAIYNIKNFAECPEIVIHRNVSVAARVFGTYRIAGICKNGIADNVAAAFAAAGFPDVKVAVGNIDADDAKAEIMVSVFR